VPATDGVTTIYHIKLDQDQDRATVRHQRAKESAEQDWLVMFVDQQRPPPFPVAAR